MWSGYSFHPFHPFLFHILTSQGYFLIWKMHVKLLLKWEKVQWNKIYPIGSKHWKFALVFSKHCKSFCEDGCYIILFWCFPHKCQLQHYGSFAQTSIVCAKVGGENQANLLFTSMANMRPQCAIEINNVRLRRIANLGDFPPSKNPVKVSVIGSFYATSTLHNWGNMLQ